MGAIHELLARDHDRLDAALARALADPAAIDLEAYRELRLGLLRHIAMEETGLFGEARARRGGDPLPLVEQLHADHAALASLLVPTPTHALLRTLQGVLGEHNPLEENPGGLYDQCEQLAGGELAEVIARMRAIPQARAAAHVDEPRVHAHIARMLAARRVIGGSSS
ncbi:MAG: hemerythrin domain-containing protein [Acidobacteriota bacterium]